VAEVCILLASSFASLMFSSVPDVGNMRLSSFRLIDNEASENEIALHAATRLPDGWRSMHRISSSCGHGIFVDMTVHEGLMDTLQL